MWVRDAGTTVWMLRQGNIRGMTGLKLQRGADLKAGGVESHWNYQGEQNTQPLMVFSPTGTINRLIRTLPLAPVCNEQFPCGTLFQSVLFSATVLLL